ncbi:unnamed protein product [Acanthoscelides obtectus]|uniref:Uncharacterized protein n=1 Tax=Acanthoscelides obtectus TaxID=200917 RepID=A0A9P0KC96_ACAOB|nr:unnamed protein product [Acanthoscelides obtectus]CAK1672645.1 hypothetical protein AOBTE_LOCUS29012 [Acanthoscelides obtectus]
MAGACEQRLGSDACVPLSCRGATQQCSRTRQQGSRRITDRDTLQRFISNSISGHFSFISSQQKMLQRLHS